MKSTLTALLMFLSTFTMAQWTTNTQLNTEVKDSLGLEETTPLTATTDDGFTWVSYFAGYNGNYQMRLQLLDTAGTRLFGSNGLLVSNQPQSSALFRYDLKSDAAGNAIVAFQDIRTAGTLQVVAYKIDRQGNFVWGNNGIQLIDPISNEGIAPTIGFTHAGNVIIGWNATGNNPKWVALTKLDPSGNALWPNPVRVIDSVSTKKYSRPTMVPCGNDGFILQYVEESGFGLGVSNIYAKRYNSNGSTVWNAPVHVSTKTTSFFFFVKAVSDGQDGYFTAFNTSDALVPSLNDVYVQHVDSSGNLWNATGNSASNATGINRFCANAKMDVLGSKFWVLLKATDGNQSQSGAIVQAFDLLGNTQLTSQGSALVPISASYDDPLDLTITNDGVIVFYFSGNNPSQTIKATKSNLSGAQQWQADICTAVSGKDDLASGAFHQGQAVAVWTDNRFDTGVYAQKINNDGTFGSTSSSPELSEISLSLYPNPATDFLLLNLGHEATFEWSIHDMAGKTVLKGRSFAAERISTSSLPIGLYVLEWHCKRSNGVAKIQIAR